jgi:hypothetical protein
MGHQKILDTEYKKSSASLNIVIKTCENLHLEEQHQLKISFQKYEHILSFFSKIRRIQYEILSQLVSH